MPTITTSAPTAANAIHQPINGSTLWATVKTSRIWAIWRKRPAFLGAAGFADSLRAIEIRLLSGDDGEAALEQRGGLLAGRAVRGRHEVGQLLWHGTVPALHGLGPEATCAVGRTHQRPTHDALVADLLSQVGPPDELLRLDPAVDRMVTRRRPQVLGDRDQVGTGVVQVAQGLRDLVLFFAHAQDQVGLGHQARIAAHRDDRQRALVLERRTDPLEQARNCLDVVREHLGLSFQDLTDELGDAVEIGDQDLDAGAGVELVHHADRLGVEPGAAVLQVVASDTGDRGVAQAHLLDRLGDPAGFVTVQVFGLAGVNLAEVAAPGALFTADQEGGLLVFPALEDVRARSLLADRVQTLGLHHRAELGVLRSHLGRGELGR